MTAVLVGAAIAVSLLLAVSLAARAPRRRSAGDGGDGAGWSGDGGGDADCGADGGGCD